MADPITHRFPLLKNVPIYIGRQEFVIGYTKDKDILHLGCVDEGMIEIKQRRGLWLYERLAQVAHSLWGVDIDAQGLEQMRSLGFTDLYHADVENLASVPQVFQKEFDLLLLSEVLEHLDNPGKFLNNLRPLFGPETELLVTIPNATSLGNLIQNWRGMEMVHPDHNYWFSLHTAQSLFEKHGYLATCVGVYCLYDYRRSLLGHQWNKIRRRFGHAFPIQQPSVPEVAPPMDQKKVKPNLSGWIIAVFTTNLYRSILPRRPFFADGLILIVKPNPQDGKDSVVHSLE